MKRFSCEQEPRVLAALRSNAWEIELRKHAHDCPLCADVLAAAEFMLQEAEAAQPARVLPSVGLIWWKSQLLARQMTVKQATRPITFARNIAYLICSVSLLWFLFGFTPAQDWAAGALAEGIHIQAIWSGEFGPIVLLSLGGAVLGTILASCYMAWIER